MPHPLTYFNPRPGGAAGYSPPRKHDMKYKRTTSNLTADQAGIGKDAQGNDLPELKVSDPAAPRGESMTAETLEATLTWAVNDAGFTGVLLALSTICGKKALAYEQAGDLKLMDAWVVAKDRVHRVYREQVKDPRY